jgi:nucleoside-diphosphate-sugar epimerase
MTAKSLVLLTGATGFVGAHILSLLLSSNYAVLAPVRSASKSAYLESKFPSEVASGDLSFVIIPDLQAAHALDGCIENVEFVCHVASPFFTSAEDPIKELVKPAVEGTKNVLDSAIGFGKELKKVIVLSSFASVNNPFLGPRAGYVYTEADWNPVTMEQAGENGGLGYLGSKTFAERTAWEMWKEAGVEWDLVTFCPPMIYGPPLHEVDLGKGIGGLNTSLARLLEGITAPGKAAIPGLPHWVDVRDVALAHAKALALPKGTSERIILSSGAAYYEDGLAGLREKGVKGLGEVGEKCDPANHFVISTEKAKKVLGMKFLGFRECVEDVWGWAEGVGLVGKWE